MTPKFKEGDTVIFIAKVGPEEKETEVAGTIGIVDANGIFEDSKHVYYDIFNKEQNMLYKHVREDRVRLHPMDGGIPILKQKEV